MVEIDKQNITDQDLRIGNVPPHIITQEEIESYSPEVQPVFEAVRDIQAGKITLEEARKGLTIRLPKF